MAAANRGTSHSRSRNSLSVSSKYNGCPPVCANRKSPSATSGVADACDGTVPAVEGSAVLWSPSPAMASRSWRVSS